MDLWECQISITSNIIPNKIRETKVHTSGHKLRPRTKAIYNAGLVNRVIFLPSRRMLDTASMLTSLIAMHFYTPFNTLTFTSLLCFWILNYLHLKLSLLIFIFWSWCPVKSIDLLRFLKSVEWLYTKDVTNSCVFVFLSGRTVSFLV